MKKIFLIAFIFLSIRSNAQSFFAMVSTPTDGAAATNTTDPTVITEPASMLQGDLCVVFATKRVATGAIAMSATGGQTWTQVGSTINSSGGTITGAMFMATFNGTWSAHPSVSFSSTTNNIAVMIVVRPTATNYTWGVETLYSLRSEGATSSFLWGFTTYTPVNTGNICIAVAGTDDDNTWTMGGGVSWTQTSPTQVRNTSGQDASIMAIYKNGTASVLQVDQTTNGPDGGVAGMYSFYMIAPAAPHSRRITIIQ